MEQRIQKEVSRLNGILKKADKESKMKALQGIVQRCAFFRIACEDLEQDILFNGFTEEFQQSTSVEPYDRERPAVKLYNSNVKTYMGLCKQLTDVFDNKSDGKQIVGDGFDDFVKK